MIELPESARALIDSGANAHLATINPDGTPQQSMVWAGMIGSEVCVGSLTRRVKLDNVERDPRVSIAFQSPESDKLGLDFYLVVIGVARLTEGGAPEFVAELAKRRLPSGTKFPRGDVNPPGWIMRIAPERFRGYGPWADNA